MSLESEQNNLYGLIDVNNVHGLNLTVPEGARAVIKSWDESEDTTHFVDSNVDDQMIIHVPFTQQVRLSSVLMKIGRGEVAPRRLRIYANHTGIVDFSETGTLRPSLDIALQDSIEVTEYPLRLSTFGNTFSVSIFLTDASGGDVSRLYYLGFKGQFRTTQKEATSKLDIPAANAADAPLVDQVKYKATGQQSFIR